MKLQTLVLSKLALVKLDNSNLPIGISWNLKKLIKVVMPEINSFEELRTQKIIEMGEKYRDEHGKEMAKLKPENQEEFIKVLAELLDKDIEVTVPTIKIKELLAYKDVNGKGIEISSAELLLLDWLIVE